VERNDQRDSEITLNRQRHGSIQAEVGMNESRLLAPQLAVEPWRPSRMQEYASSDPFSKPSALHEHDRLSRNRQTIGQAPDPRVARLKIPQRARL